MCFDCDEEEERLRIEKQYAKEERRRQKELKHMLKAKVSNENGRNSKNNNDMISLNFVYSAPTVSIKKENLRLSRMNEDILYTFYYLLLLLLFWLIF